eukprot:g1902.t1
MSFDETFSPKPLLVRVKSKRALGKRKKYDDTEIGESSNRKRHCTVPITISDEEGEEEEGSSSSSPICIATSVAKFECINHVSGDNESISAPFSGYKEAFQKLFSTRLFKGQKFPFRGQGTSNYCALYAVLNAVEIARGKPFSSSEWTARKAWANTYGIKGGTYIHLTIPQYIREGFTSEDGVSLKLLMNPEKVKRTTRSRSAVKDLDIGASVDVVLSHLRKNVCVLMLQNVDWKTTGWTIESCKNEKQRKRRKSRSMTSDNNGHSVCAIGICHISPENWPKDKSTVHIILRDSNEHGTAIQRSNSFIRGICFLPVADLCAEPDKFVTEALASGCGVENGEGSLTEGLGMFVSGLGVVEKENKCNF